MASPNLSNSTINYVVSNSSSSSSAINEHYVAIFFRTGIWECIVALIGMPANLLVLCLGAQIVRGSGHHSAGHPNSSSCSPHPRRTYNQYYVLSMTLADLIFCSVHSPLYGLMYAYQLDYSFVTCKFLYLATHICTVASSLSLLCLNIDKFVAVHKPLHHSLIMGPKAAGRLLASAWVISGGWALLLTLGPLISMPEPCRAQLNHPVVYYVFAVVFFVLPILLSALISMYVAVVSARRNDPRSPTRRHSRKRRSKRAHAKTLTFVFCTTIWSTVTSIPYRTSFVLRIYNIYNVELSMFLFGLMAANALGNPFITILTQRQYRSRLRTCVRWPFSSSSSSSLSTS